ncbi:hypothetical protein [Pigmentiphaga sp. NML080357]|nr:hypothetical protein [Pigmentiphaga sp. NML080357]
MHPAVPSLASRPPAYASRGLSFAWWRSPPDGTMTDAPLADGLLDSRGD